MGPSGVSVTEIQQALKAIRPKRAVGPDRLPVSVDGGREPRGSVAQTTL